LPTPEFSGGFTLYNIANAVDFCGFEGGGGIPSLGPEFFPAYMDVKKPCRCWKKSSGLRNVFSPPLEPQKSGY